MAIINGIVVRTAILEVIQDMNPQDLQSGTILHRAVEKVGCRRSREQEQILLTEWYELFRTGYLAWGSSINNPDPPFCHLTRRGEVLLGDINRDPANPSGYMRHLKHKTAINEIAESYLCEGLECYSAGSYKAAAVMVGAASESIILELRHAVLEALTTNRIELPKGLEDWRIRTISNALVAFFNQNKRSMQVGLREAYEAYWPAFTQQIRATRNEVGHPSSINPITPDAVHAQYLVFPELVLLVEQLHVWLQESYS